MAGEIIPISDEQARAIQEIAKVTGQSIEAASKFASFWAGVFGTVPHNLVGLLLGDRLHHARLRNLHRLQTRTEEILRGRGVKEAQKVSEDIAEPILEAARKQDRPELQELWARLLAAAMDPARAGMVRQSFINAVMQFDPIDARVFEHVNTMGSAPMPNWTQNVSHPLNVSVDEVEISIDNLDRLKCLQKAASGRQPFPTAFGRELMRAISG